MHLIIDGYNVIFASGSDDFNMQNPESARRQLLSLLSAYRAVTHDTITVAFDGNPAGRMYPQTQNIHGITVIFSESDADADMVIKRLIAAQANPNSVIVVSSDNSIRRHAKRFKCENLDSEQFLRKVDQELRAARATRRSDEPIEKYEGLSAGAVDYWMKIFDLDKKKP